MAKQLFYYKYAAHISLYAIIFLTMGVTISKLLDDYMPKLDENKNKLVLLFEIYIQIILLVIATYIFREYVNYFLRNILNIYGNPDKFAILILATPMFSQQQNLIGKIKHVWADL